LKKLEAWSETAVSGKRWLDMSDETVECLCCRESIKKNAVKCTKCDSYQDWRRYLSVSNLTLGLLVALVANLTSLYQVIQSHSKKTPSIKAIEIQQVPDCLRVAVSNSGNAVAIVRGGRLQVKRGNQIESTVFVLKHRTTKDGQVDPFIEPSKGKILEFQPYYNGGSWELPRKGVEDTSCKYVIQLDVIGFDSTPQPCSFETAQCIGVE
jgi:hypothetical protein